MRIDPFKASARFLAEILFSSSSTDLIARPNVPLFSSRFPKRENSQPVLPSYVHPVETLVARWLRLALCTSHLSATRSAYLVLLSRSHLFLPRFSSAAAQTELPVKRTIWDSLAHSSLSASSVRRTPRILFPGEGQILRMPERSFSWDPCLAVLDRVETHSTAATCTPTYRCARVTVLCFTGFTWFSARDRVSHVYARVWDGPVYVVLVGSNGRCCGNSPRRGGPAT